MKRSILSPRLVLLFFWVSIANVCAWSQARPYPGPDLPATYERLLADIQKIPIFDHHAHPGFAEDTDVDAMASPPGSAPLRERLDNPELVAAAKAMWGYPFDDLSSEHARWLIDKKAQLKRAGGTAYFDQVLDKLGIETSVANRVAMPSYLDPKRFRWVFFVDSFMFPFNNQQQTHRNPDQQVYIPLQEKVLHRYMQQAGLTETPADLAGYLQFITRVLQQNQEKGGIAMKFEAAYFRPLKFGDPPRQQAETIYRKYRAGGVPSPEDYRTFQDFIFRYLVSEGGRLHLAVHIHTAVGVGDYYNISNGNIMNLENVLRDPRYINVTWVMIHGGYPLEREAIWLAAMKNVYMDSSLMEIDMYPSGFKNSLKEWLELFPDKITFGSDAFPYNEALGAEESYWMGVQSARMSLAAALAEMVSAGEISNAKAHEMAHAYLHDTAARLYPERTR
jgi:predicted TIM-barrel fold metal-dependent hydrolase